MRKIKGPYIYVEKEDLDKSNLDLYAITIREGCYQCFHDYSQAEPFNSAFYLAVSDESCGLYFLNEKKEFLKFDNGWECRASRNYGCVWSYPIRVWIEFYIEGECLELRDEVSEERAYAIYSNVSDIVLSITQQCKNINEAKSWIVSNGYGFMLK